MAHVAQQGITPAIAGSRRRRARSEAVWGIICVSPAVLGFLLWGVGPMVASFALSLTDWSVSGTAHWIGFSNFRAIFHDDLFWQSSKVTLIYAFVSVPLQIVAAIALALLLNEKVMGLPLFRTIIYLPSTVPFIASSMLWLWLYNPQFGPFNAILESFRLPPQQWLFSSSQVLLALIIMSLWGIGPMMIIYLAGLQSIPQHLYDAVSVDGGYALNRLWNVTILFNLVLSIIGALQTFTQAYVMTQGGPGNSSLFYGLYLYNKAFQVGQLGYAAALAVIQFAAIVLLSLLVFRSSSKWVYYGG